MHGHDKWTDLNNVALLQNAVEKWNNHKHEAVVSEGEKTPKGRFFDFVHMYVKAVLLCKFYETFSKRWSEQSTSKYKQGITIIFTSRHAVPYDMAPNINLGEFYVINAKAE